MVIWTKGRCVLSEEDLCRCLDKCDVGFKVRRDHAVDKGADEFMLGSERAQAGLGGAERANQEYNAFLQVRNERVS